MRYDLGLMDMYPIETCGSCVENDPMFKVTFKTKVDPVRLEDAVYRAIKLHPLFGTQVRFDRVYFLETNSRPVKIAHAEETKRPMQFGVNTNGYPWQICWFDRSVTLEWNHGVTDGKGAFEFLKTVLSMYCGVPAPVIPRKIMLGPGLEPFVDYSEKGHDMEKQPQGFSIKDLPVHNRGFKTDCHVLEARTEEILALAKKCGSSPSAVLAVLLSQAIRKHLPEKSKNRNVACNIVMDLRKPLQYETMHNCVEYKRITYQDRHEEMKFEDVAREYKKVLDIARDKRNVIKLVSDRVRIFEILHAVKSKRFTHTAFSLTGLYLKHTDCNCVLSYLGRADFPQEVEEQVEDLQFRVWHDFSECILAAVDYAGKFKINICENFIEKGIVEDFIEICRARGINWTNTENLIYEQASFIEEANVRGSGKLNSKKEKQAAKEKTVPLSERAGSPVYFL